MHFLKLQIVVTKKNKTFSNYKHQTPNPKHQTSNPKLQMDDKFIRYTKLNALILLLFLSIPVVIGVVVGMMYGFAKVIFSRPADFMLSLFIVGLPAALFSSVYYIFFVRTKKHPSKIIRSISYLFFAVGFASCLFYLGWDLKTFLNNQYPDISYYQSYSLVFMAGNIGMMFFTAIMQAFAMPKEKDWMDV